MSNRSSEPWKAVDPHNTTCPGIDDAEGRSIVYDGVLTEENVQRIIACVNACRYMPQHYLEWLAQEDRFLAGTSLKELSASVAKFEELIGKEQASEIAALG